MTRRYEAMETDTRQAQDLIAMIDYLDKDVRSISPTGAHFLQMAKAALANPQWDRREAAAPLADCLEHAGG
ncbi:MAG: hypothetical protein RIB84_08450 [Sneathiellaceae bacterium]